ncbi:MAG TPA: YdeI/OmpD-associated family protein, partial [Pirellulaceae bacterium]|nr:YdeI/OmpD-associated family protein [Pirellulaceae bacterium]
MGKRNIQVDAYIEKSAEFAQPILRKLRELFLAAGPELDEVIKWGVPHYEFQGLVAGMAAFKQHVSYGFWKATLMSDPAGLFQGSPANSMCSIKVTSLKELPSLKLFKSYVREAIQLNMEGVKFPKGQRRQRGVAEIPADLRATFRLHKQAAATFESLSPSHQREYLEWIEEAKKPETRARRLEQTI